MSAPLIVIMLDDARFGAGPGAVVEGTTDPISAVVARYTDRDGARSEKLRFWLAPPDVKVGDRVALGVPPRTAPVRGDPDSIDVFAAQGGDRPAGRRP